MVLESGALERRLAGLHPCVWSIWRTGWPSGNCHDYGIRSLYGVGFGIPHYWFGNSGDIGLPVGGVRPRVFLGVFHACAAFEASYDPTSAPADHSPEALRPSGS